MAKAKTQPITPESHRPKAEEWGSAKFVFPELDMLLDLGKAIHHPQYSVPHVDVARLAAFGVDDQLPRTYQDAIKSPDFSQYEKLIARVFYNELGEPHPIEVRTAISETLSSMINRGSEMPGMSRQQRHSHSLISLDALRTSALELSNSSDPEVARVGQSIEVALAGW